MAQTARCKAFTYLRQRYPDEFYAFYREEITAEPLFDRVPTAHRNRRNARAQSRASLRLKAKYPETYRSFRQQALDEGFSPTWRPT